MLKRERAVVRRFRLCAVMLVAGCVASGGSGDEAQPPSVAAGASSLDAPFTDSAISISIRGNDGSTPGDVLLVGQSSRLLASVLAVERAPDGEYRGLAHDVAGARLRWRSLTPQILGVDSVGRVHALRTGRAAVEAVAVFAPSVGPPVGDVRDTMGFRVLPEDVTLSRLQVTDVSAPGTSDAYQTCAVTQDGAVACWRPVGRMIGEETARAPHMFRPPAGARFRTVVTGIQHVCALTDSGRAYCWGVNEWGQVGAAGQGVKTEPTPVAVAAVFGKLSSGRTHTCGVTTVGELFCWGLGTNNALGPAGTDRCTVLVEDRPHHPEPQPTPCARTPRPVPLPDPAIDVAVGDDHTCALTTRHELFCWGWVYNIDFAATRPTRVADGGARLVQIASGSRHVCGLDAVGQAYCWGRNWDGQIGTAAPRDGSAQLTPVTGAPPLRQIAGADDHTCGIATDGRAFCWGRGINGQLGGVVPLRDVAQPTVVAGDHVWRSITAGFSHTCAITAIGSLYCWGSGLGFRSEPGSFHEQPEPFLVAGWR